MYHDMWSVLLWMGPCVIGTFRDWLLLRDESLWVIMYREETKDDIS